MLRGIGFKGIWHVLTRASGDLTALCRDMFERFFTPEAVDKLRPMVQKTIDTLLDNMIHKGCQEPVDFIRNFAESIPIQVSH